MSVTPDFDLFLSYRRSAAPAIQPLLDALAGLGLRVWRDKDEIEDFASIQKAIDDGLAKSRALLEDWGDLAIDQALRQSLADEAGPGRVTVHTLIARSLRFRDAQPVRAAALRTAAVAAMNQMLPAVADIRRHKELEDWVAHARLVGQAPADEASAELLGWVARYYLNRGDYLSAREGWELQLEARFRLLGAEHPDTSLSA